MIRDTAVTDRHNAAEDLAALAQSEELD
jgi:hypothetical protein